VAKKLFLLAVLACMISLVGCSTGGESDFTIKISGTDGLAFRGSYLATESDGSGKPTDVEGTVPVQYDVTAYALSCMFQKQSEAGTLTLEITRGGRVVNEAETTDAYGMVSAHTDRTSQMPP
jgi:hypothetical protein